MNTRGGKAGRPDRVAGEAEHLQRNANFAAMMLDRQDRATLRNDYATYVRYNRFCANRLRCVGDPLRVGCTGVGESVKRRVNPPTGAPAGCALAGATETWFTN